MIKYPIHFCASLSATAGILNPWTAYCSSGTMECAIPPEFEGPGGGISPEDLFAQALLNCFTATFKVMAEKSRVNYDRLSVEGRLTVDRDDSPIPLMKSLHLSVVIFGCDNVSRAESLVNKSLQSGFILNSVRTVISHDLHFVGGAESLSSTAQKA